jgi:hypothetical protein
MPRDYIPSTDAGKLTFGQNAVALITPAPLTWNLTAGIATQLGTLVSSYEASLLLATQPSTRSRVNTSQKNIDRDAMVAYLRQTVVPLVQAVPTVTDQMKVQLGITVRGASPLTPINPPTIAPIFDVLYVKNRIVGCQLRAPESDSRGKPSGVQGCSICLYAGTEPTPPTDITKWITIGESSRNKFEIEVPSTIAAGTTVYLVAFWKSPRLMSGPASAPVSLVIGGGVQQVG